MSPLNINNNIINYYKL